MCAPPSFLRDQKGSKLLRWSLAGINFEADWCGTRSVCPMGVRFGSVKVVSKHKSSPIGGENANLFYKRKAGAHENRANKRMRTRQKAIRIKKILKEY